MNNSSYLLHTMGLAVKEMGKPKTNLLRLNTQVDAAFTTLQGATIDRLDSIRTKKRLGANQIFDTDSFVPDALKCKKRPTAVEKVTAAAKTLAKAKTSKK